MLYIPIILKVFAIIYCICAIIAVLDRMNKGSDYIFKRIEMPTMEDIICEYIYISLLSPIILFNKYIAKINTMWNNRIKKEHEQLERTVQNMFSEIATVRKYAENLEMRLFQLESPLKYKDGYVIDQYRTIEFGQVESCVHTGMFDSFRHIHNKYYIRNHATGTNYWLKEQEINEILEDIRIRNERIIVNGKNS